MGEDDQEGGGKRWTLEQLRGESVLRPQTGTNRYASQKGMTGFGQPRWNIYTSKDQGFIEPDRKGEEILRPQCGTNRYASQKGTRGMGTCRPNVANVGKLFAQVVYKEEMEPGITKASERVLSKQAGDWGLASQAGEVLIGAKRNNTTLIVGKMPRDPKSHETISFQSGGGYFATQSGMHCPPGVGAFRNNTLDIEGAIADDVLRQGSADLPWSSGRNKFATQAGSGGFHKVRDVLPHIEAGTKLGELDEEKARASHGMLPLQNGTNRLASQRGMTGFGTPRTVLTKTAWKQEWIDEYDEAVKEWEANRPSLSASMDSLRKRSTRDLHAVLDRERMEKEKEAEAEEEIEEGEEEEEEE